MNKSATDPARKSAAMSEVAGRLAGLSASPLYAYRLDNGYQPVIGEGSLDAGIVFVGEAPGKNEAKSGRPFCGASGRFLDVLLTSIGLDRSRVYITNIVKDRPPDNRDPTPAEIALYGPLLDRQIEIIAPRAVVTLGRHSMGYVMDRCGLSVQLTKISEMHGRVFSAASYDIVTLYHPAAALYNGGMRDTLKVDFAIVRRYLHIV